MTGVPFILQYSPTLHLPTNLVRFCLIFLRSSYILPTFHSVRSRLTRRVAGGPADAHGHGRQAGRQVVVASALPNTSARELVSGSSSWSAAANSKSNRNAIPFPPRPAPACLGVLRARCPAADWIGIRNPLPRSARSSSSSQGNRSIHPFPMLRLMHLHCDCRRLCASMRSALTESFSRLLQPKPWRPWGRGGEGSILVWAQAQAQAHSPRTRTRTRSMLEEEALVVGIRGAVEGVQLVLTRPSRRRRRQGESIPAGDTLVVGVEHGRSRSRNSTHVLLGLARGLPRHPPEDHRPR